MLPMVVFINEYMLERLILIPILFERGVKTAFRKTMSAAMPAPLEEKSHFDNTKVPEETCNPDHWHYIGTILAENSDAGIGL
ncbi:MAG: hypothetical protein NTAFB09_10140 [Nitrosospira sp.]